MIDKASIQAALLCHFRALPYLDGPWSLPPQECRALLYKKQDNAAPLGYKYFPEI